MIPRTITFDEIEPGDSITFEWSTGDMVNIREGDADRLEGIWWRTSGGEYLAFRHIVDATITLLDRPTPPLPQGQGTPIMVYRFLAPIGRENDRLERVMIRECSQWRDMAGCLYTDDQILSWAPLTPGDRIDR